MDSKREFSDADKILWKKIKRNGHFSKRKKDLIKKIYQESVQSSNNLTPDVNNSQPTNLLSPEPEPPLIENEQSTNYNGTSETNNEKDDGEFVTCYC